MIFDELLRNETIELPVSIVDRIKLAINCSNQSLDDLVENAILRIEEDALRGNDRHYRDNSYLAVIDSLTKDNSDIAKVPVFVPRMFKENNYKEIDKLELACRILNIYNSRVLLGSIISHILDYAIMSNRSLRNRSFNSMSIITRPRPLSDRPLIDKIERLIDRKRGNQYNMLKAFYLVENNEHTVLRDILFDKFKELISPELVEPTRDRLDRLALNTFRLMCSNAPGAYGSFFKFDSLSRLVSPSDENSELIIKSRTRFV